MSHQVTVAGVDGWRRGWVAVVLVDGEFEGGAESATISSLLQRLRQCRVVAIDIPIGLPEGHEPRDADLRAKRLLGARRSSVFLTPIRQALQEPTLSRANQISKQLTGKGLSAQAYALRERIFEVEAVAGDPRILEVHPEVTFHAMAGSSLPSKKTWNGQMLRRQILNGQGIVLPNHLGEIAGVPSDDVLDAAAAAWSAHRFATSRARSLPPGRSPARPLERCVIWY